MAQRVYWKGGNAGSGSQEYDPDNINNWVTSSGGSTVISSTVHNDMANNDVIFDYATVSIPIKFQSSTSRLTYKSIEVKYHDDLDPCLQWTGAVTLTLSGLKIAKHSMFKPATGSGALTIKFTGEPKYTSFNSPDPDLYFITDSSSDAILDIGVTTTDFGKVDGVFYPGIRGDVTFLFEPPNDTKLSLQNGVYPKMDFDCASSDTAQLIPRAVNSNSDGTNSNNCRAVFMYGLDVDSSFTVKPSGLTYEDRASHWIVEGALTLTTNTFDMGFTTFELTSTQSELKFPVTGTSTYGTDKNFTSKFTRIIIGCPLDSSHQIICEDNTLLSCEELIVEGGARFYGPVYGSDGSAEIHTIKKPTINGDWNFGQVADGIYRTIGTNHRLNVSSGGTGLNTVPNKSIMYGDNKGALQTLAFPTSNAAGKVLAINTNGDGFEWSSTAGGGGVTVKEENTTLSTTATTLKFVGSNVTASGTGSEKTITIGDGGVIVQEEGSALSTTATTLNFVGSNVTATGNGATKTITITDANTTTTADVLSALNADWGGNKTFGTDVADTATFSGPLTAGFIDALDGFRSTKMSTNTSGDNTTYSIRANLSQSNASAVTGISRLQGIYINNSSGSANHSGEVYQHGIKIEMTGTAAGTSENRGIEILSSGADKNYGLIVANAVTSGFGISSPDITSIAEFQRNAKAIVKLTSTDTNNSSNSSDTVLEMKTGHASALNQLVFSDPDASAAGRLNYLHASDRFVFEIGGSSIASITASGIIGTWDGNTISVAKGGTGQTTYTNGQLLIGNSTGNTLAKGTLTAGSNITITNGAGSIEIAGTANDDVSVANLKDRLNDGFAGNAVTIGDSDDVVTIGNKLVVSGDLTVSGTTTTVNSTTLTTADCLISLATGQTANGADALDIGFYGTYNDGSDSNTQKWRGFYYDKSGSKWKLFTGLTQEPTTTVSTDNANHGFVLDSLKLLNLEATGTITGDVTGDLTGNADTATNASNASNVGIVEDNSTDASFYPSFVNGTSGNKPHKVDSGLTYNPSTGMLTAAGFTGTLTGNASGLSSTLAVASGGTGKTTLTSNGVLTGNGTNPIVAESNLTFTGGTLTVKGDKSNEEAILKVQPDSTNGRDAVLVVEGARNLSTTANTAMIRLQNQDDHLSDANQYNILGAIVGRVTDHSDNHGDMHFLTYADGATASETMTLKGDGKVGIGTTSPAGELHVAGSIIVDYALAHGGDTNNQIQFDTDTQNFKTDGTTRMTITSAGKVGINNTSPSARLHVETTNTYQNGISDATAYFKAINTQSSNGYPVTLVLDSDHTGGGTGNDQVRTRYLNAGTQKWQHNVGSDIIWFYDTSGDNSGSWVERMRFTSDGKLGIGDSTPSHKLDVNGTVKGTNVRAATSLGFDGYNINTSDGVELGLTETSDGMEGIKTPGSFKTGFSVTNNYLAGVNITDGTDNWDSSDGFYLMTINIGNTGGVNHTDIFHAGTINVAISCDENDITGLSQSIIWGETINFVALGGGDFNANSKIDYTKTNTLGRVGDETVGTDKFDIALELIQVNSKYYLVVKIKNMTGVSIPRSGTGLLITGDMTLLRGQAHTG